MTREEAIDTLTLRKDCYDELVRAINIALGALSTESNCKDCKKRNNTTFFMDDEEALDMAIETLSTEVVRCKDCRYSEKMDIERIYGWLLDMNGTNYDFCSWSERKGGNTE